VISTDISIIGRHKFGRSRRVGRCRQNVLHLVSVGQWMQVRTGCRAHRRSRRIARGRGVCVSGRLVRRPRGVAQCLPAFAASSERPCGVDRVARAGVGRACSLEDLQYFLPALSGVTGDLTGALPGSADCHERVSRVHLVGRARAGQRVLIAFLAVLRARSLHECVRVGLRSTKVPPLPTKAEPEAQLYDAVGLARVPVRRRHRWPESPSPHTGSPIKYFYAVQNAMAEHTRRTALTSCDHFSSRPSSHSMV